MFTKVIILTIASGLTLQVMFSTYAMIRAAKEGRSYSSSGWPFLLVIPAWYLFFTL